MSATVATTRSSAGALSALVSGDPAELPHAYSSTLGTEKPITTAVMRAAVEETATMEGEKEEEEMRTASSSLTSSLLSSSTPSISSSTTTDTSVASDVNTGIGTMDKIDEDKVKESENGNTMSTATITDMRHANTSPISSSSTSLPPLPPTSSSSASNVNSSACSSAVSSLLQQQQQQQQILNVRFAPLPEMAPRKRKSKIPLGMAARGQLARRRRALTEGYDDDYYDYDDNGEEERRREEKARKKAQKKAAALARAEAQQAAGENKEVRWKRDPESDPFVALARKMGQAGKQIWKKVSNKDIRNYDKETGETGEGNKEEEQGGEAATNISDPSGEGRHADEQGEQTQKNSIGDESLDPPLPSPPPQVAPEPEKVVPLSVEGTLAPHPHTPASPVLLLSS